MAGYGELLGRRVGREDGHDGLGRGDGLLLLRGGGGDVGVGGLRLREDARVEGWVCRGNMSAKGLVGGRDVGTRGSVGCSADRLSELGWKVREKNRGWSRGGRP